MKVGERELLDVDHVGDEKEIHPVKDEDRDVPLAGGERDDALRGAHGDRRVAQVA